MPLWTFFILLTFLKVNTQDYLTDEFIEISLYSRGKSQDPIDDIDRSYIYVVNDNTTLQVGRGLGIVVIDETNGTVIDALSFDVHLNGDNEMVQYLNEIKTNKIICIVGFDEPGNSNDVISILNSWGCTDVMDVLYRESFIFIGTKNTVNISNFTYCQKSAQYDSAILKTFQIPINLFKNRHNFPYRMIQMNGSYTCDPLTDNLYVAHNIDYDACQARCTYDDECVMTNFIPYSKTSSDSRCYLFGEQCDLMQSTYGNLVGVKGFNEFCINYPLDWVDTYNDDCDYYHRYRWCHDASIDGNISIASFVQHSDHVYGLNAIQTCCDCGGGLHIFDDIKIEFAVSLDGMASFYNSSDPILCDWNLGDPNQYSYYDVRWTSVHLFDLCTKLKQKADHKFVVLSNEASQYNRIQICDSFVDPSSATDVDIILCDFDSYEFNDRANKYFISVFKVNVNETSVYLNSHWFNYSQLFAFSNNNIRIETYEQCLSSLLRSAQSTLHAIYPCDILTPSPTSTPTTYPTATLLSDCAYFNEGPIATEEDYKLTTVTVGQDIIIEFDFIINTDCNDDVCNLLHIGIADGVRMPGIWMRDDGDWVIRFSNNEDWNSGFVVTPVIDTRDNEVHHMLVIYSQERRMLFIDDEEHYFEEGDFTNTDYHNTYPLYVSDPWYPSLDSIISNLCIKGDATQTTIQPTDDNAENVSDVVHKHSAITALIVIVVALFVAFVIIIVILYNMNEKMMQQNHDANNGGACAQNVVYRSGKIEEMETEMETLRSMVHEMKAAPPVYVASTDNSKCILCVDKVANMFNYPCGHVSYCWKCSLDALQQDNKCPNCRGLVLECKTIYSGGFAPDNSEIKPTIKLFLE